MKVGDAALAAETVDLGLDVKRRPDGWLPNLVVSPLSIFHPPATGDCQPSAIFLSQMLCLCVRVFRVSVGALSSDSSELPPFAERLRLRHSLHQ